jgi:hypothetical protein
MDFLREAAVYQGRDPVWGTLTSESSPTETTSTLRGNCENLGPGYTPGSQIWVFQKGPTDTAHKAGIPRLAPEEKSVRLLTGSRPAGELAVRAMLDSG